jgi:Fe-S cluster biogenesis protein NfuA
MTDPTIPVTIYSESTPNPEAMKFVANMLLLQEGSREYIHPDDASDSPLARQLFSFSGVKSVFITANFITITKNPGIDWYEIVNIIREFIRNYIATGEPVFKGEPSGGDPAREVDSKVDDDHVLPEGEIEQQIVVALNEYVRPAVEQDGGAIHFRSFNEGVVTVLLKGSCSGCPSSTLTLKSGIENLLTKMIPEVKEVVAENG